jgi:hypothetical protein
VSATGPLVETSADEAIRKPKRGSYKMKFTRMIVLLGGLAVFVAPGRAQLNGNTVSIALSASNSESVSLSCDTASLNFSAAVLSNTFHCTTTWNVSSTRNGQTVAVAAHFTSGTALTGPGTGIPTSAIIGTGISGTPGSCNQTVLFPDGGHLLPNSCSLLYSTSITPTTTTGTNTSPFTLAIPTLGTFPAGNFSGTLQIDVVVL